MRSLFFVMFIASCTMGSCAAETEEKLEQLQIGVKFRPETCERKSKNLDRLSVHYTGTLVDGTEFDSSVGRGRPFDFQVGKGQVIQGWDRGMLGMCIGEKRRLKIPYQLAYGERGSPPKIPPKAKLIFEVELVDIL